jgi:DNA-binding transcriptional MerR regulator
VTPRHPLLLRWRRRRHLAEVTLANAAAAPRRTGKSSAAFRTTGEVSEELNLPAHVLRFWESKFPEIKPLKRGGGRRYYRPEDVDLLRRIRQLLYQEGYTIRGVQKLLRERERREESAVDLPPTLFQFEPAVAAPSPPAPPRQALQTTLEEVRRELLEIRALLGKLTKR